MGKYFLTVLSILFAVLIVDIEQANSSQTAREKIAESEKKEIVEVLQGYEELFSSFFTYDAKQVEANAAKLASKVNGLKSAMIKKNLKSAQEKLAEIKSVKERDANNQNLHLVSLSLIYLVNKYDIGSEYNVYACPMVQKKWIQNSTKLARVTNPYDPRMPNCGNQVTEY